jgi:hypothetical protein
MRTTLLLVLSLVIAGVFGFPTMALATSASTIVIAQNDSLGADQEPKPCDCTNCSAEHCQPPTGGLGHGYLTVSNIGSSGLSCSVIQREPKRSERKLAGPFATRDEALKAMQQIPECQSRK